MSFLYVSIEVCNESGAPLAGCYDNRAWRSTPESGSIFNILSLEVFWWHLSEAQHIRFPNYIE